MELYGTESIGYTAVDFGHTDSSGWQVKCIVGFGLVIGFVNDNIK